MDSPTASNSDSDYRPTLTDAGLMPTAETTAMDETGVLRQKHIAEERPLTIFLGNHEVVTLMTLGVWPELLTLGYLYNQGLIVDLESVSCVLVDWNRGRADVTTLDSNDSFSKSNHLENTSSLPSITRLEAKLPQSYIYLLLKALSNANNVYRTAGGVHGCAICEDTKVLSFVEDIGRHNAADIIAGYMWLNRINGTGKQLYCTGRLTSEIVIKAARMNISTLLSRSGVTQLGLQIARDLDITLIARAKGTHFLVYHGYNTILYDANPAHKFEQL